MSGWKVFNFPAGPDQGVDQSYSEIKGHWLESRAPTAHKTRSLHRSNPGSNQQSAGPHGKRGSPTEMGTRV